MNCSPCCCPHLLAQVALITAGCKAGLNLDSLKQAKPRIGSVPFESEHKFMATVHQTSPFSALNPAGRRTMFVKGAPDRLMPMCCGQLRSDSLADIDAASPDDFAPLDLEFWRKAQEDLSSEGLRVLALCRGDLNPEEDAQGLSPRGLLNREPRLAMVALLAILDPPRDEAIAAVKVAHAAGITVKMITGEQLHHKVKCAAQCQQQRLRSCLVKLAHAAGITV